jgi:capsular exopolysaccharide synthesis family protein
VDRSEWIDDGATGVPLSPLFVAATEPGSSAAEQYRLLRTRLEGRDQGRRAQFIVVTSPGVGDGKTTTSANLALTMAQEFQHTVVLVEADLRRPTLAGLFGVRAEPGLVDVLVGAATLDDALVNVPGHNLFVLPAGFAAGRSTELLASSMMARVADALRARFDRIVIDTPPVTLADTHVLARLADGVLFVVRAGVTPRPALEHALAGVDRERVIGIVLNEVDETPGEYAYQGPQPRGSGA